MDYQIEKKPMIKLAGKQLLTSNNQDSGIDIMVKKPNRPLHV